MSDATVRLRAAIDYLRRKIDGYDSTFETAEGIAAGAIDLRGIGPVPATEDQSDPRAGHRD